MATMILLLVFLEIYHWILLLTRSDRRRQYLSFSNLHNCSLPPSVPSKSNFLHRFHLLRQDYGNLFDDYYRARFEQYGSTHALYNNSGLPTVIHTIDPANLHAVTVTKHDEFVVKKTRSNALYSLAQEGLITTGGQVWKRNRSSLSKQFNDRSAKDTRSHERGVDICFEAMDEEGRKVENGSLDVTDFLRRMTLDRSSRVLLGLDAGFQEAHLEKKRKRRETVMEAEAVGRFDNDGFVFAFTETWETMRKYVTWGSALGSKYWLAEGLRVRNAVQINFRLLT